MPKNKKTTRRKMLQEIPALVGRAGGLAATSGAQAQVRRAREGQPSVRRPDTAAPQPPDAPVAPDTGGAQTTTGVRMANSRVMQSAQFQTFFNEAFDVATDPQRGNLTPRQLLERHGIASVQLPASAARRLTPLLNSPLRGGSLSLKLCGDCNVCAVCVYCIPLNQNANVVGIVSVASII
jgi:hypothetical protein